MVFQTRHPSWIILCYIWLLHFAHTGEAQAAKAELQEKYYAKFRKDLSARQVEKVLRLNEPFGHKPCCGKFEGKGCGKHEGKKGFGPKPEGCKQRGEIKN